MSHINIDSSCNSRVGNVNALPASNQTLIHWLLDSGASIHITDDLSDFTNYHKKSETATTATGIKANMEGSEIGRASCRERV